ncbi:hypothetical protein CSE16_12045 [Solibacillus sp. R5-41]|uniref:hypothetical protein n=1 Tax=Solibacillus sp. R5-41 TaxID=2048654 RepID=UPI000C126D01|nr:hypothetical protein [Solibacillus sp. R5-41]ATP40718.1 hypothetical protein CSE16_12045 [Solibacillus sp. R5-41]
MTPTYESNTAIYDNYRAPARFIEFEGHVYKFKGTELKADVAIHNYRCNYEQHNLRIHLQGGVPFYVEGIYKIEDSADAVLRAM